MVTSAAPELTVSFTLDTTSICEILLKYIGGRNFSDNVASFDECENIFSIIDEESESKLGKVAIKLTKKREGFIQNLNELVKCEPQIESVNFKSTEMGKVTSNCLKASSKSVVGLAMRSSEDNSELEAELFSKSDFNEIDSLSCSNTFPRCALPLEDVASAPATSAKEDITQSLFNQIASSVSPKSAALDLPASQAPCNKEIETNNGLDLLNSFLVEDQLHKCSKCPYETWSKKYLLQHHRNQHANLFVYCAYCGTSFRQKYLLRRHYVSKHCINEETAQRLIDSIDYISHDDNNGTGTEHPKPPKSPKTFHADLVEFLNVLQTDRTRGTSLELNDNGSDSKACSSGCDSDSILRNRLRATGSENAVCEICMLSASSKSDLDSHYRKEHKMDPETIKALNCASNYIKSESSKTSSESANTSKHDAGTARVFRVPNLIPQEESNLLTSSSNSQKTANLSELKEKWDDDLDSMSCFEVSKNS